MLALILQETFVPLKGGCAIFCPREAPGRVDRPSKNESKIILLMISYETFVPLMGGWVVLRPRVALGRVDLPTHTLEAARCRGDRPSKPHIGGNKVRTNFLITRNMETRRLVDTRPPLAAVGAALPNPTSAGQKFVRTF